MATREPKSQTTTMIKVVGRDGKTKGSIEINSGNVSYFRTNAREGYPSARWTLQQLIQVMEDDVLLQEAAKKKEKIKGATDKNDIVLHLQDQDDKDERWPTEKHLFSQAVPLKQLDVRQLETGAFQVDMYTKPRMKGYCWCLRISINSMIWMLDLYVEKWLKKQKGMDVTNEDIPVSKRQFAKILRGWLSAIS